LFSDNLIETYYEGLASKKADNHYLLVPIIMGAPLKPSKSLSGKHQGYAPFFVSWTAAHALDGCDP
jgi:hypothetical protein